MSRSGKGYSDLGRYSSLPPKGSMQGRARVPTQLPDRSKRVIQRDLVYVIGIPVDIATEEILSRYEYFGQYGKIKKIVVNNTTPHNNASQVPTVSAYITFCDIKDAEECLYALEGFVINDYILKASFGTSKYCSSFLSGQKCMKPDCMYLHHYGKPEDSFTTEEIQSNSQRFTTMTRPSRPADYFDYRFQRKRKTVFPPRRILEWEEEETDEPEPVKATQVQEDKRNAFIANLMYDGPLKSKRLVVDYSTGQSLNDMFGLGKPTIRAVLNRKK